MDLSIIIINWNSKPYLRGCLESLESAGSGLDHEVLVIDNASYDGCAEMLAAEFPTVSFIQSNRNLGFAGGNNCAARQAKGDFLLFLNPDTAVAEDALAELVRALRRLPDAGAVGARLLNSDWTQQTSCIQSFPTVINQLLDCELFRGWFPKSRFWGMAALFSDSREPSPVEAICGACVMIKSEIFARIGRFEERYFMYSEDLDLSFKVHQAGHKCYFVPTATVIHHGGGSTKAARSTFASVMMRESVYRFMQLRRGWLAAGCFRFSMGLAALFRLPLMVIFGIRRGGMASDATASIQKWISILGWSLGLAGWVRNPR